MTGSPPQESKNNIDHNCHDCHHAHNETLAGARLLRSKHAQPRPEKICSYMDQDVDSPKEDHASIGTAAKESDFKPNRGERELPNRLRVARGCKQSTAHTKSPGDTLWGKQNRIANMAHEQTHTDTLRSTPEAPVIINSKTVGLKCCKRR